MDSLIELNPQICNGRPVVRGTRISVETVLTYLCAGDSVEDVLAAHPRLTRQSILACLDYARRLAAERVREGFEVAIVGAPNAGKSTLLNRLAQREVALVTVEVRGRLAGRAEAVAVDFLFRHRLRQANLLHQERLRLRRFHQAEIDHRV